MIVHLRRSQDRKQLVTSLLLTPLFFRLCIVHLGQPMGLYAQKFRNPISTDWTTNISNGGSNSAANLYLLLHPIELTYDLDNEQGPRWQLLSRSMQHSNDYKWLRCTSRSEVEQKLVDATTWMINVQPDPQTATKHSKKNLNLASYSKTLQQFPRRAEEPTSTAR